MAKNRSAAIGVEAFRRIALNLPGAEESSHMGNPDFRVGGRIFATLASASQGYGNLKLTPEQQRDFVRAHPAVFVPVKGGWGRRGCTNVLVENAEKEIVRPAMMAAWRNTAPKRVVEEAES